MNTLEKLMYIALIDYFPKLVEVYVAGDDIHVISKTAKGDRIFASVPFGYLNTLLEAQTDLHDFITGYHDGLTEADFDVDAYVKDLITEYGGMV